MRGLFTERGMAYSWFAVLLALVALPLFSLSIDITRMMYIRSHLQTASDAACQAAVSALDAPYFVSTGQPRIDPALARARAARVFSATVQDAGLVGYAPTISISFPGPRFANCQVGATVSAIIPLTPLLHPQVETTSEMRVRTLRGMP